MRPFAPALLILALLTGPAAAEDKAAQSVLEESRNHLLYPEPDQLVTGEFRFGMKLLSAWGGVNAGAGLALVSRHRPFDGGAFLTTEQETLFWRGVQDFSWGLTNLAIGLGSLAQSHSLRGRLKPPTNARVARIFAVNCVLDIVYLGLAAVALGVGASGDKPFWRGTGNALLVQGGFLLAFDLAGALRFAAHSRRLSGRTPAD